MEGDLGEVPHVDGLAARRALHVMLVQLHEGRALHFHPADGVASATRRTDNTSGRALSHDHDPAQPRPRR
jgi:hypothetical protein